MTPQQLKKPETVSLTLTLPEVDLILMSMGQRPFDQVAELIGSVRSQVIEQITAFNQPKDEGTIQ